VVKKFGKYGYCHYCRKMIKLIPIFYGLPLNEDGSNVVKMEEEGACIITDVPMTSKSAVYACCVCGSALPEYGLIKNVRQ
jgi:hypothetical protein